MAESTQTDRKEGVVSASSALRDRLRRQTGEASRRQAAVDVEIDRRLERPPEPGDLFVLAETAEHPVEWAILDREPADPRRLLAVPVDTSSLIGSADVAASGDAARGSLSLRCAHSVWIDADPFDPELRTGFLEPEALELARQKIAGLERGAVTGSVLEREVDGEAEYQERLEMLEQARTAAPERLAEPEPEHESEEQGSGTVVPFRPPSRWGSTSTLLAVAASVLIVVALGYGLRTLRVPPGSDGDRQQAIIATLRGELERLNLERRRLEESRRQDLARLEGERQRTKLEHRQRIAELRAEIEAATQPSAVTNLPLILLAAGQLRGNDHEIEVAPDASHLMLILQIDEPGIYSRYRLDIREQATQRQVWRDSGLEPSRLSELTVLLPRSLMPDGRYELRLDGVRDSRPEPVMEQILTLTSQ